MSSTTKKTPIDPKSKEYADSLQTTAEMYRELSEYERSLRDEDDRKKNRIAEEISRMGETYIAEIDAKHEEKENERLEMIDYILETTKEKLVKGKDLVNMSHEEVKSIYKRAQDSKKSWFNLLIEYLMGW